MNASLKTVLSASHLTIVGAAALGVLNAQTPAGTPFQIERLNPALDDITSPERDPDHIARRQAAWPFSSPATRWRAAEPRVCDEHGLWRRQRSRSGQHRVQRPVHDPPESSRRASGLDNQMIIQRRPAGPAST
jgi:hypothetical protein